MPLCVRDDTSRAAIVIQHSVTTWQAYNRWGGYSLYYGNPAGRSPSPTPRPAAPTPTGPASSRSTAPTTTTGRRGAADFVGNELPVIYQAEQLGLDVTYWTDVDLHASPQLLDNHKAPDQPGPRRILVRSDAGRGGPGRWPPGVNLAFLGANACYRQIRFESSPLGTNRRQVCYKSAAEDPMTGQNDALVTVNWPQPPVSRPESELIGSTYQDVEAQADMVVTDPASWILAGTGLSANQRLPERGPGRVRPLRPRRVGPANLDVIAHSIVPNRGDNYSDITWYTVPGGGGVFATGNASWVGHLSNSTLIPPNVLPDAHPRGDRAAAADNGEPVRGHRDGPGQPHPPLTGELAAPSTRAGSPSSAAPNTVNAA